MAYHNNSLLFLVFFFITNFICSSNAKTFQVGGKAGWTLHPSESYNTWSSRLRFLINDSLRFKYDGGSDSVLVVNKGDYDGCNSNNPIMKLEGGDSTFKLDRSGPFYFISGNKSHCDQGQKLSVVVLSPRNRSPPPPSTTTPPSPSTLPPPPSSSPVPGPKSPVSPPSGPGSPELSPSGTPVMTPPASSPGGGSGMPGSPGSPSGTPVMTPPASSPGGGSGMPGSPESSPSGSPVMTPPAYSPGGVSGTSPASSPGGESGSSPTSSPGGGSGFSPASSPGPGGGSGGAGGPGQAPGGNNPAADVGTPPSAATPLSGSIIASFVTTAFALLCLN